MSKYKINPEWKKYNDFYNEGGEGYNPYKKWLVAAEEVKEKKYSRDVCESGKTLSQWKEYLLEIEGRLTRVKSEEGKKLTLELYEDVKNFIKTIEQN